MSRVETLADRRDSEVYHAHETFDFEPPRGGFPVWRTAAVLSVLIAAGVAAYLWFTSQRATPPPAYTTAPVLRGDVSVGASATGPLSPMTNVPVSFKSTGQITEILVQVGQRVSRGQALVQLDTADLERTLATARAQLDQQVGALAKLQQGTSAEAIAAAQTQVQGGTANLASARRAVDVAQASRDADIQVAANALDNAQSTSDDAAALLQATSDQLESARRSDAQAIANAEQTLTDAAKSVDFARAQAMAVLDADRTAVANAETALDEAHKGQETAREQLDTASGVDDASVANAETALAHAQKALQRTQNLAGTSQGVQQALIDKAQQDVTAAEANRDAVCGMAISTRAQCQAARSSVDQARAALAVAQTTAKQTAAQNLQAIQTSQAQLDQTTGALQSAKATKDANQAHNRGPLQTAEAQVATAAGVLDSARGALAADETRQQAAVQAAQRQADQALSALQAARATAQSNAAHDATTLAQSQQAYDQAAAAQGTARAQATQTAARGVVSVQTAEGQATQAAGQLATLQGQLQQTAAPPTDSDLAAARAQVAAAQVAVDQAQANLSAATLVAPVDGVVAQINAVVGQTLSGGSSNSASSSALMSLVDLDQLQVQAQVNESDMAGIRPGNPITFTVSAFPGSTFSGHVESVQPLGSQSQNVVTYTVVCSVDPTDTPLLPGMTASVTLVADSRSDVVVVVASAIQFAQSQGAPPGTVLVMANGTPVARQVQTGLSDGRLTEVVAGLQPGEVVVTGQSGR